MKWNVPKAVRKGMKRIRRPRSLNFPSRSIKTRKQKHTGAHCFQLLSCISRTPPKRLLDEGTGLAKRFVRSGSEIKSKRSCLYSRETSLRCITESTYQKLTNTHTGPCGETYRQIVSRMSMSRLYLHLVINQPRPWHKLHYGRQLTK